MNLKIISLAFIP